MAASMRDPGAPALGCARARRTPRPPVV